MMHDLYYSLKGKPFLMMESDPQLYQLAACQQAEAPGIAELSALQAVAHGSDSVCYFQWRASRGAEEKLHRAVVGHDGREDARPFRETAEVGETLEQMAFVADTRRVKQAAIVCMTGEQVDTGRLLRTAQTAAWATGRSRLATDKRPGPPPASPWISLTRKAT